MASCERDVIHGWSTAHGVAEYHRYAPGPAGALVPHSHDTYQLCFSFNLDGVYAYRGREHAVPSGSLSVLAPLEVHHAWDPHDRGQPSEFLTLYPSPQHVRDAFARLGIPSRSGEPLRAVLDSPVIRDASLGSRLRHCVLAGLRKEPSIVQQHAFDQVLACLLPRCSPDEGAHAPQAASARIRAARDAIVHAPTEDWTIERLAKIVHHSPAHFAQAFSRQFGLPPHRFVMQQRVDLARRLLAQGESVSRAASRCGFADQSHLSKWFARYVQTTAGRYASHNRRNVLIDRLMALEA